MAHSAQHDWFGTGWALLLAVWTNLVSDLTAVLLWNSADGLAAQRSASAVGWPSRTNEGSMCGFRPSASTLATWLSSYYFSAAYCKEEHLTAVLPMELR